MAVRQMDIEEKRQNEQTVLNQMIRLYCRGKHHKKR